MTAKQALLTLLLVDFTAVIGYALYQHGLGGMIQAMTADAMSLALSFDLCLALGIAAYWTWRDGRERGINALPYVILTALTGSAGLLLYLIRRERPAAARLRAEAA